MHSETIRLNAVLSIEKTRNEIHGSEKFSIEILGGYVRLLIGLVVLAGQGKIIIALLYISPYCLIFPKPKDSQHSAYSINIKYLLNFFFNWEKIGNQIKFYDVLLLGINKQVFFVSGKKSLG